MPKTSSNQLPAKHSIMRNISLITCLLISLLSKAQVKDQVYFKPMKNWNEALSEAKRVNKPIFVDLYATWCGPCKKMDSEVYTDKEVANYVNTNFVAIKVQGDSTKSDDSYIKGWYSDAVNLKFYASAYPSFLFYTSDGKYSGKEEGYYNAADFLVLLKKVIDPIGSYATQLASFEKGVLNKVQMRDLAQWAKKNKDTSALKIAKAYKMKYIDGASIDSLLTPESDRFIVTFIDLFTFDDKIITYIYKHQSYADSVLNRYSGYAKNLTDYVIAKQFISDIIRPNGTDQSGIPEWEKLKRNISKKFDDNIASRLVLDAKIDWAHRTKHWDEATEYELDRIDKYGLDTSGMGRLKINNLMYDVVFKYVENPSLLARSVDVMKRVVALDDHQIAERLDTYASILYKAGNKDRAIEVEKKALDIGLKEKNEVNVKFYTEMLEKMRNNVQTWK